MEPIVAILVAVVIALPALAATFYLTTRAKLGEVWQDVAAGYKEEIALRDHELERLREQANVSRERIAVLEEQVAELAERDQEAVLEALRRHDERADARMTAAEERADARFAALLERLTAVDGRTDSPTTREGS